MNEAKVNVKGKPSHPPTTYNATNITTLPYISPPHAPSGAAAHPLFQFLSQQTGQECSWNFCKYLIAPDGQVLKLFPLAPPFCSSDFVI
jgi:glutathione peroxidase-family protein